MDMIHAVVLAIVEGVTEFLPVSSTGHMIIVAHILNIPQTEFVKTFEIAIQCGAIAAVFSMYWRTFLLDWEIGRRVCAAFIPTAIIGFVLYKLIKKFLLGNLMVVGIALLLGGIFLIIFEKMYKESRVKVKRLQDISYSQAVIIGVCQSLAVVPGVSRSAATIIGGLCLGVSSGAIVEFSFLLAVPTMFAATVLDLVKSKASILISDCGILGVGFVVALGVAFVTVKFLIKYVQRNNFIAFGVYRIMMGLLVLFLIAKI